MPDLRFALLLEKARPPCELVAGAVFALPPGVSEVGRDWDADVVLADPRVSRRHLRVETTAEGVWVENLSSHPVYRNGERLEGRVALAPGDYLQVGGVLLRLVHDTAETEPGPGPMSLSPARDRAAGTGILHFTADRDVVLLGVPLALQPAPFRALEALALQPGQWVTADALAAAIWVDEAVGPSAYVNKYISYVRAELRDALASHPRLVGAVQDAVVVHADRHTRLERIQEGPEALLREFLKSRKKVGYRLLLGASEVTRATDA